MNSRYKWTCSPELEDGHVLALACGRSVAGTSPRRRRVQRLRNLRANYAHGPLGDDPCGDPAPPAPPRGERGASLPTRWAKGEPPLQFVRAAPLTNCQALQ